MRDPYAQLGLAELATANSSSEENNASASCAVVAGYRGVGRRLLRRTWVRSRAQNHRDAVALLQQVSPGGPEGAGQLEWLLVLKDQAQYGFEEIAGQRLVAVLRQARALVTLAEQVLAR